MGVRRGNRNKNKGSGLKAQDFLKTGLNDTNNDSTENSSQVDSPQTVNSSTNSQPTNPSKRIRLDESFEEEEVYELQDELNKLKENIKNVKKSQKLSAILSFVSCYLPKISESLVGYKVMQDEVNQLKEVVHLQREEIKSLKSHLLNNQISKASKSVIVKGLEPETPNETTSQLRTTFNKVLTEMGIQSNITTCNIFRIKSKTPPPTAPQTEVHEPVKISFLTSFERKMFMKNLKNLRTYQNLKISMDCPQMLLPEYRIADKKAYDLRAQAPGTKTFLTIKDQKVIILAKGPEQNTYKEWKEPVTEAETTEI